MFNLTRLVLTLAIFDGVYCVYLGAVIFFPWSVLVLLAGLAPCLKRRGPRLTAHGTARLAEEEDLRKAKMIGGHQGLILGTLPEKPQGQLLRAAGRVLDSSVPAEEACRRFLQHLGKRTQEKAGLIRLSQAIHMTVFAPTRSGKGASCILPFLITTEESFFCVDPKGENALLASEHLRRQGFEILILDPHKLVSQ
jgi:type IV secretion system protein VirD4